LLLAGPLHRLVLPAVQPIEISDHINTKEHSFAIEDELLCPNATGRLDSERIAAAPV
jgi:hypothetical protein